MSAQMSEVVKFMFYYGPGSVKTNESGVDLSSYDSIDIELCAPQTWALSQLTEWLTENLGYNIETHTVGVHALWCRSRANPIFYLRPIERDSQWTGWLQGCEKRNVNPIALVLPVQKELIDPEFHDGYDPGHNISGMNLSVGGHYYESGQSSQAVGGDAAGHDYESGQSSQAAGGDASGYDSVEADADEIDGHMQNQMEDEDTDIERMYNDDSDESDEEDEAVQANPAAWNHDFSHAMTVNDGHDSRWQYHQNNIAFGALYPDKQALKDAIIKWAMSTQRVFKTKVSSQKYLTMECVKINCPGRVHGYLPKNDTSWKISDLVQHTCVNRSIPQDHPNLSSALIARLFYTEIVESKSMEVRGIQLKVKTEFIMIFLMERLGGLSK